ASIVLSYIAAATAQTHADTDADGTKLVLAACLIKGDPIWTVGGCHLGRVSTLTPSNPLLQPHTRLTASAENKST
ncbi:hypothetical protein IRJ41_016911, partial [Triplophysa rosa]